MKKATKKKSSSISKNKTLTKKAVKKKAIKKKAVNKTAVKKKTAKKKAAKKKAISRRLNPDQYFYLRDGGVLKSLHDLARMMDEFEDEVFSHHVNDDKHDFANWIEDVFEEADLARQLMDAKRDKEKNHYIVLKYVVKGK